MRKIVLFLSKMSSDAQEKIYICPDGTAVIGKQTNEAPVKYLMNAYDSVSEIVCFVTEIAAQTAWEHFRIAIQEDYPDAVLTKIDFDENEEFQNGPLKRFLEHITPEDEILLETTGGFRNSVMYLLLLSRILSYTGVKTLDAVYSSLQEERVHTIKHLVGLFDLVGGMQELSSFGSVRTLRTYYQGTDDPKIRALLLAAEKLREDISLCRTRQMDEHIADFDKAISEAENCSDPLMRQLLPAYRRKFGRHLTTPGIIKWCLESNMLQQALTIYKERIPYYLLHHPSGVLRLKSNALPIEPGPDYQSAEENRIYTSLLKMSGSYISTFEHFEERLPDSCFTTTASAHTLRSIAMDYLYIRMLRNMINHANEETTESQNELNEYFIRNNYPSLDDISSAGIASVLRSALNHLRG